MLSVLFILCVVFLLLFFLVLPGESDMEQRAPFWGMNCAHRGLHTRDHSVPENSLPAFTKAIDAGYGIELDIQLSSDKEVVVFHDDTLARVCGEKGRVDSHSLAQLQQFRLLNTQHRIPLLREVLDLTKGDVPLIIELKTGPNNRELCERAWKILRLYDGDICIESFDPRIVRWFKKHVPGLLRGQLAAPPASLGGGIKGLAVGWGLCNVLGRPHFIAYKAGKKPLLVQLADRFAMKVVWTARPGNNAKELERQNDAVIFEFYLPEPCYKDAPDAPDQPYLEQPPEKAPQAPKPKEADESENEVSS